MTYRLNDNRYISPLIKLNDIQTVGRETGLEVESYEPTTGSSKEATGLSSADPNREGVRGSVSVIVPFTNPRTVHITLEGVYQQEYPKKLLEVIVVGKGSRAIGDQWPQVIPIETQSIVNPGEARNLGASTAQGDYLLFLDDDCKPLAGWISKNVEELSKREVGAVGGTIVGKSNSPFARATDISNFSMCRTSSREVRVVCSATFAMRSEVFEQSAGFDESLRVHEDIDMCHKLERLGYLNIYQPSVKIVHDHGRESLRSMINYLYFGGRQGGLSVEERHKDLRSFYRLLLKFKNPLIYSLMVVPFAVAATLRSTYINAKIEKSAILLSPIVFVGKLSCQLGIARNLFEHGLRGRWMVYGTIQNIRRVIEYSFLKRFIKLPRILTLFVTSQCNAKCGHCFYWQELNQPTDMSLADIRRLSEGLGKLDKLLITGGEPTLSKDLAEICRMFFENNDVNFVSIPTNGLLPQMILARIRGVLEVADGKTVNVSFSLDGLEDVHDELRGVPGNFEKLLESYRLLRDLQDEYGNLSLRVNSVLMNRTIESIEELIDEFATLFPDINTPALTLLRGSPYDKSLELPERSKLKQLHNHKMAKIPGRQPLIWRLADWATFNASLETLRKDTQVVSCEAGRLLGVVEANGDVKHCELLPAIGNIQEDSFQSVWQSEKAREERAKIVAKECKCTHECNLFPSMMAHPVQAASALAQSSLQNGGD